MSLVHIPEDNEDKTIVTPGGISKQWIYAPALEDMLLRILNELKKIRMHNEVITNENITEEDINEDS